MIDLNKAGAAANAVSAQAKGMPDANAFKFPENFFLKSCHGKYLIASPDGKAKWDVSKPTNSCKIHLVQAGEGKYGLQSVYGKFLSAQPNGSVEWNRDKLLDWETWVVESKGERIALKSHHKKYLSAQPDGRVEANRPEAREWETFIVEA